MPTTFVYTKIHFWQLDPLHGLDLLTASLHGFAFVEVVDIVEVSIVGVTNNHVAMPSNLHSRALGN